MDIYESYELAEGSLYPSMTHSFESIENILDTIETIRYNSNEDFFAFSSEGFVDFVKKIWAKFVAIVKRFANWIKELFGRIFQTGVLRKAVKGAKYSVNIAFKKRFKSESIIKKYGSDDKVMKEFRKYCVDLRFFTWFAFGSGGEDIDAISKSLNNITDIDSIINKLMESGTDISDTVKSYSKAFEDDYNVIQGYIENNDKGYNQKLNREQMENSDSPIVNTIKTIRDVFMKVVGNSETFEQYYDKSLDFKKRKEVPMFHANKVYDRQKVLENFMKTFNNLTAKIEKYDTSKYTEKEDAEKISKVCQMLATVFKTVSKFLSFINNNIMSAAKSIITLKKENKKLAPIVDDIERTGGKNIGILSSNVSSGVAKIGNGLEKTKSLSDFMLDDNVLEIFSQSIASCERNGGYNNIFYVMDDTVEDETERQNIFDFLSICGFSPFFTFKFLQTDRVKLGLDHYLIFSYKSFMNGVRKDKSVIDSILLHEVGHNIVVEQSLNSGEDLNHLIGSTKYDNTEKLSTSKIREKFLYNMIRKYFGEEIYTISKTVVDAYGSGPNEMEEVFCDLYSLYKKRDDTMFRFLNNDIDYDRPLYAFSAFFSGFKESLERKEVKCRRDILEKSLKTLNNGQ